MDATNRKVFRHSPKAFRHDSAILFGFRFDLTVMNYVLTDMPIDLDVPRD